MNSGAMNTRGAEISGQDFFDLRFLFPERLADVGENFPAAQFRRVLVHRRGGIGVLLRAMAQHHQRGVGKVFIVHAKGLAQEPIIRKRVFPKDIFWQW